MTSLNNYRIEKHEAVQKLKNDLIGMAGSFVHELTALGCDDGGVRVAIPFPEKIDAFRGALRYVLEMTLADDLPVPSAAPQLSAVQPVDDLLNEDDDTRQQAPSVKPVIGPEH